MHTPWRPSGHIGDPSKMVGQLAIEPANAMREPHFPFSIPHSPLERANRQKKKTKEQKTELRQGRGPTLSMGLAGLVPLGRSMQHHLREFHWWHPGSVPGLIPVSRWLSPTFDAMRCGPTQSGSQLVSWTDMRRELGTGNWEPGTGQTKTPGTARQLRNCNRPLGRPKDQWQVYAVISRLTCCCNAC